jgi:3-hydroxyisobutyrate dehydrogenase-like beta-hydroxyacid dehydrogenase
MARRLVDAGHEVVVWNRTRQRVAPLVELGAAAADSPAAATSRVEAVITMVSDPDALRAVIEGPDGVAATIGDSTTLIEMSTVGPEAVKSVASVLPGGTPFLDAPVLGSLTEAEAGELKIFVGGSPELVEKWKPLLSAMGFPMHLGPLGSGAAAKLVANSTLLGTLGVLGEGLGLARALGLSWNVTFEVLAGTPVAAQAERRRPQIEAGDGEVRFTLALARKDADLIAAAAADAGIELRVAEGARKWFADAEADGEGNKDYSAVLTYILGAAGAR